jgi:hypothetical protein
VKKTIPFVTLAFAVIIGLSGCAAEDQDIAQKTAQPTPSLTQSVKPTTSPTPVESPSQEASVPITIDCATLLSDAVLKKSYPGYSLNASYSPASGSYGAQAQAQSGLACQWKDPVTSSTITVSASHLGPQALAAVSSSLSGNKTSEFSGETGSTGSFDVVNGEGIAQLVTSKFYITAISPEFYSSADAIGIMSLILAALEWDANN